MCPDRSRFPGGRRRAPRGAAPSPASGAPFPASTKGPAGGRVRGGGGAGGASRRRTKLWSRLSSEEGSGRPRRPAGFLPPRGEEEPPAPEADWGISGSGALPAATLLRGHFCRRKTLQCLANLVPARPFQVRTGTVLFLAELRGRKIAQVRGVYNRVSKKNFFFFRIWSGFPYFLKQNKTKQTKQKKKQKTAPQSPRLHTHPRLLRLKHLRGDPGRLGTRRRRRAGEAARGAWEQVSPCIIEPRAGQCDHSLGDMGRRMEEDGVFCDSCAQHQRPELLLKAEPKM